MADEKTKTVTIGKKQVELIELSCRDSLAVDHLIPVNDAGIPSPIALSKIYALAAVRKVDGEALFPCSGEVQFHRVEDKFTAFEAFALAKAYSDSFEMVEPAEIKNELRDPD